VEGEVRYGPDLGERVDGAVRVRQASIVTSGEHWSVDLSKAVGSGERDRETMSCRLRGV
jgi:hypothetical protein